MSKTMLALNAGSSSIKFGLFDLTGARAFSSEVDTGSREENASKQESRAPFRFYRNGRGSGMQRGVDVMRCLGQIDRRNDLDKRSSQHAIDPSEFVNARPVQVSDYRPLARATS